MRLFLPIYLVTVFVAIFALGHLMLLRSHTATKTAHAPAHAVKAVPGYGETYHGLPVDTD